MKNKKAFVVAVLVVVGLAAAAYSAVNITEGSWEITMSMEMTGVPFQIPPTKYTVCLTRDNLNPQKKDNKQDCRMISQKTVGSTYSWVAECNTKQGPAKSEGSITYNGTTMNGVINTTTRGNVMKQKLSGRRVGDCSK